MMKTLLIKSAALLLVGIMLLGIAGCSAVTQKLDGFFKEETKTPDHQDDTPEIEMPSRAKETYTILVTTEAVTEGELDHVMLVSFNTASPSVSILQLPTDLYLHISERSVGGLFTASYNDAIADGQSEQESAAAASEAVIDVLAVGFNTPIDYYINFSSEQLEGLVNILGGVEMTLPFAIGTIPAGKHTLSGSQVIEFLSYNRFSDLSQALLDARKLMTAAIFNQAKETVETEMLSLFVMELRTQMTTNIPTEGGEDIFFVRKWLQTPLDAMKIANLSTQMVYVSSNGCRVLFKDNTLKQMNTLLALYEEELTAEQFDPKFVFVDYSSDVAKVAYNLSTDLPTVYDAKGLMQGSLILSR